MSRFNGQAQTTKTVNRAGGKAYEQSPKLALASLLLASFLNDKTYESGKEQQKRLTDLVDQVDPLFAAKAAVYARNEFGMRSTSHVVAARIAGGAKGTEWGKRFYTKVVRRPDDITEILSINGVKNMTNAMRKGFRTALESFDEYQLGKYKMENKAIKLVDVVNLTHAFSKGIDLLTKGLLAAPTTYETKLSATGQGKKTKEEVAEAKADAWRELLAEKKIGYFALLRNLRNIEQQAPELIPQAAEMLQDEKLVRGSLVLPFRFLTAYQEVTDRTLRSAISRAIDLSCANVPKFDGKTLIAVDTSGSMYPGWSLRGTSGTPIEIASLFAAIMYKAMNAQVLCFDNSSREYVGNPDDSTLTIAEGIRNLGSHGGTYFGSIFQGIKGHKFDRIFIISDMQSWVGNYYGESVPKMYREYVNNDSPECKLYSFDVAGYGDMQFPEHNVFTAAGWSEKVFDVIKQLESGKDLVKQIEEVEI